MHKAESIAALILAGGSGTRLRSIMADRPKVLAPVYGRPFVYYLLDQLTTTGFRQVILSTGYKGNQVREALGDEYENLTIHYSQEPEPLDTAGAVRYALPLITSEAVLVMNGDSYVDADINSYLAWYFDRGYQASLFLTHVTDTSRYGRVEADMDGSIICFQEKQAGLGPGWINAGIYLLKAPLVELIPPGAPFSLERQFFPSLVGKSLYGYFSESDFLDIGVPESYAKAEHFLARITK